MPALTDPLTLPCGQILPNRLAKGAMTEGLADVHGHATQGHVRLYRRWAEGGVGLQITGNVQIDRRGLERPGNVVIEGEPSDAARAALAAFAAAAKVGGGKVWMQINHAGRQAPSSVCPEPVAPSALALAMPGGVFAMPRALSEPEINDLIGRFAKAALVAKDTGFDDVQIHAAHGYLLSQFLSPKANQRDDQWGGSLENRARFLVEVIKTTRAAVGADFAVGVKLNSADFQKGGFSFEDCLAVIDILNDLNVDLVEITGGNYEQPKMAGIEGIEPVFAEPVRASTKAREAYFAGYAKAVRERAKMPVMATGGFRTRGAMEGALSEGDADLIGIARPLCADPDLPKHLLSGTVEAGEAWENKLRLGPTKWLGPNSPFDVVKALNGWGTQGWFCLALMDMGAGQVPNTKRSVLGAFMAYQKNEAAAAKALLAARAG